MGQPRHHISGRGLPAHVGTLRCAAQVLHLLMKLVGMTPPMQHQMQHQMLA